MRWGSLLIAARGFSHLVSIGVSDRKRDFLVVLRMHRDLNCGDIVIIRLAEDDFGNQRLRRNCWNGERQGSAG